jgi:hypothetical protein
MVAGFRKHFARPAAAVDHMGTGGRELWPQGACPDGLVTIQRNAALP